MPWKFIQVASVHIHSFLLLTSIPWMFHSLSDYPLAEGCLGYFHFWLLRRKLPWTLEYRFSAKHKSSFIWNKFPGVRLLVVATPPYGGCMLSFFFFLIAQQFSRVLFHFVFPSAMYEWFSVSTCHLSLNGKLNIVSQINIRTFFLPMQVPILCQQALGLQHSDWLLRVGRGCEELEDEDGWGHHLILTPSDCCLILGSWCFNLFLL